MNGNSPATGKQEKERFSIARTLTGLSFNEQIRKRRITRLLTGKAKEKTKGISVQETITFEQISPDGICLVKEG